MKFVNGNPATSLHTHTHKHQHTQLFCAYLEVRDKSRTSQACISALLSPTLSSSSSPQSHRIGTQHSQTSPSMSSHVSGGGSGGANVCIHTHTHTQLWRLSENTNIVFLASSLIAPHRRVVELVHCGQFCVCVVLASRRAVRQTLAHARAQDERQACLANCRAPVLSRDVCVFVLSLNSANGLLLLAGIIAIQSGDTGVLYAFFLSVYSRSSLLDIVGIRCPQNISHMCVCVCLLQ